MTSSLSTSSFFRTFSASENENLVSSAAVFWDVTQCRFLDVTHCVTSQKTAAKETKENPAFLKKAPFSKCFPSLKTKIRLVRKSSVLKMFSVSENKNPHFRKSSVLKTFSVSENESPACSKKLRSQNVFRFRKRKSGIFEKAPFSKCFPSLKTKIRHF